MWPLAKPTARQMMTLVTFLLSLLTLLYFTTLNGEDYAEAKRFVEQDPRLETEIGKVASARINLLSGFTSVSSSATGHASYSFSVTTNQGTFDMDIRLRKSAAKWYVETAEMRGPEGRLKRFHSE